MLKLIRVIIVVAYGMLVSILGSLYSLVHFRNPNNVYVMIRWLCYIQPILGIRVECRFPENAQNIERAIYIGNHQNNYDLVTISSMLMPRTVTVGKKSLIWIPFFGLLYWATGNIFLDRDNRTKAHGTMAQLAARINQDNLSIFMFPEGTRSRGRGLLPFKTGAFHAAIAANVPIVPIVCSTTQGKIDLNRWDNGKVICEMLPAVDISNYSKENIRELAEHCHHLMLDKICSLDNELK